MTLREILTAYRDGFLWKDEAAAMLIDYGFDAAQANALLDLAAIGGV